MASRTPTLRIDSVGDRLRYLIERSGYTQVELAAKIGLGQSAISNLLVDRSRKPSAPTLLKLAAALHASPEWIISGDGEPYELHTLGNAAERQLIAHFREMDPQSRRALLEQAKALRG